MKKILVLGIFVFLAASAHAFPIDNTAGGLPFSAIQQQNFVRTEMQHFKEFMDASEKPISSRYDSPEKIKQEYKIKELRSRAPKIDLNNYRIESTTQDIVPQQMQLKEQDGRIFIQGIN